MRFKILAGNHYEKGPDGKTVRYRQGEIVDSKHDLSKFNSPPMSIKFERVGAIGERVGDSALARREQVAPQFKQQTVVDTAAKTGFDTLDAIGERRHGDTLDSMSLKELQTLAAEEEIDLKGITKKEEIVKTIRAVMQPAARSQP